MTSSTDTEAREPKGGASGTGGSVRAVMPLGIAGLSAAGAAVFASVTVATNDYGPVLILGSGMGVASVVASVMSWRRGGRRFHRVLAAAILVIGGLAAAECLRRLGA